MYICICTYLLREIENERYKKSVGEKYFKTID